MNKFSQVDSAQIFAETRIGRNGLITLSTGAWQLKPLKSENNKYELMEKTTSQWQVFEARRSIGLLTITESPLFNSDYYYLLRYEPYVDNNEPFFMELKLADLGGSFWERHTVYPTTVAFDKSVWHEKQRVKKLLPKYTAILDNEFYSMWVSMSNVYVPRENGTLEEQYDMVLPIKYKAEPLKDRITKIFSGRSEEKYDHRFIISFPQKKGTVGEQWSIISEDALIDWNHPSAPATLRIADLNRARKWSAEGVYYPVPESYAPYSEHNFWPNPAHHIGEVFIRSDGGRLFDTFGLVSLYTAVETQNSQGYWPTRPRSSWLFDEYGIDANFYDTRFSTDAGLFLIRGYKKFGDHVFLQAAEKYAGYLTGFAADQHFKTPSGGILVYDYGHDHNPQARTHSSLNHHITEMNFLYEIYLLTGSKTYLATADLMKKGVKDTSPDWRAPNNDLHYACLDGKEFGLKDYPLLTLKDLRYSQKLIKNITGSEDTDFQNLIKWKTTYLKDNNLPLY